MCLLRIRNLKKSYKEATGRLQILNGIDLEMKSGEMVAITGESGSGKLVSQVRELAVNVAEADDRDSPRRLRGIGLRPKPVDFGAPPVALLVISRRSFSKRNEAWIDSRNQRPCERVPVP